MRKSANEETTARMHSKEGRRRTKWRRPTEHFGTKQDASASSKAESLVVKTGRKSPRRRAPNTQSAFGFQEEAHELVHALESWSDTITQYWVSVGRKS